MKKIIVFMMIAVLCFGIMGCEGRKSGGETQSETESFVAFEKDEIVTTKNRVEKIRWEAN